MKSYQTLKELVAIDSPSGFTHNAAQYTYNLLQNYGWQPQFTNKGAVTCTLGNKKPTLAIAAHLDTLGAMVSKINGDGTLQITNIGGLNLASFDSEYCRIYTHDNRVYTGTLLLNNPSVHTNQQATASPRSIKNMHIRIDEIVTDASGVESLGINVGDFVCFETRYEELPSGFIKSRFMDNKAGCYILFEIARRLKQKNIEAPVELFFSNYEEVGHGGTCGYAPSITQLLVIDMAVISPLNTGLETHCTICAKDSSGPYDYEMRKQLINLSIQKKIPYKVDIYQYYGSDGSAALSAGQNFKVALIGPGVAASHGMERTHTKGIEATINLCLSYISTL